MREPTDIPEREPTCTVTCTSKIKIKCLWLVVGVIELFLTFGLVLVFIKYRFFVDAVCRPLNGSNVSNASSLGDVRHWFYVNGNKIETSGYMHVMLIIFSTFLSFLKIPEYFMLAWGTHKWLLHEPRPDVPIPKPACSRGCVVSIVLVVAFLLLLGAAISYFGVEMELEEERCKYDNSYGDMLGVLYKVHCGLDLVSALLACFVRAWMVNHTYKVKYIWSSAEVTNEPLTDASLNDLLTSQTAQQLAEDAFIQEYEVEYEKKGEQAKEQMMPFAPWFLMPLLHFVVLTLINPHLLLTPWTYDHNGRKSKIIAKGQYFYFAVVIVQFVQILIQNGCAMRMNQYHKDYYREMEERVVYKYGHYTKHPQTTDAPSGRTVPDDSVKVKSFRKSYILIASQMSIAMKFKDEYNFEPTFFSFVPHMNVDNPYILIVLVIGIIVSALDFLYK